MKRGEWWLNEVNDRMDTISSPALAKNVITVGASNSIYLDVAQATEQLAFFSSRGNPDSKRILPDIVAPGLMYSAGSLNEKDCKNNCNDHNSLYFSFGTYPFYKL